MTETPASKSAAAFDALFARDVLPAIAPLETERRKVWQTFIWSALLAAPALALVGFAIVRALDGSPSALAIAAVVGAVVGVSLAWMPVDAFKKRLKAIVLPALGQALQLQWSAQPVNSIAAEVAQEVSHRLKLLPDWDRFSHGDEFSGTRAGCGFRLNEIKLEERRQTRNGTRWDTVFEGQLIEIAFPRSFLGETVVLRDASIFNSFNRPGDSFRRIGLADPRFENTFEVFGTDQVEGRYLVDPLFMQSLLDLEAAIGGQNLRCGFSGGWLMIALETGDRFEMTGMDRPLSDPAAANQIYNELTAIHAVIDALVAQLAARRGLASEGSAQSP